MRSLFLNILCVLALTACPQSQPEQTAATSAVHVEVYTLDDAMKYQGHDIDGNEPSVTAKNAFEELNRACIANHDAEVCERRDWLATKLDPWCYTDRGWGPCMIPSYEYNELSQEFKRNPVRAMDKFRGMLVEVRGPITEMEPKDDGRGAFVRMGHLFNDGMGNYTIILIFADKRHLLDINNGDRIGVECVVLGYNSDSGEVVCGVPETSV